MKKQHEKHRHTTPSSEPVMGQPEDAFELINKYGTYNIQPTSDSGNEYPAVSQGLSDTAAAQAERQRDEWLASDPVPTAKKDKES